VCLGLAAAQTKAPPKPRTPVKDPPVIDLRGFRALLEQNRGRPLLLNFWATWCQPCHTEYPMINELARKYAPQGLQVIGISLDEDAEMTLVRHFLERNAPSFPNYRKRPGDEEAFDRGVDASWNGTIPATFFFSRDGRSFARLVGGRSREEFEKTIQALLASAPPGAAAAEAKRHPAHP